MEDHLSTGRIIFTSAMEARGFRPQIEDLHQLVGLEGGGLPPACCALREQYALRTAACTACWTNLCCLYAHPRCTVSQPTVGSS